MAQSECTKEQVLALKQTVDNIRTQLDVWEKSFDFAVKHIKEMRRCGICYHFDIHKDLGGVCTVDHDNIPCDRNATCDKWKMAD